MTLFVFGAGNLPVPYFSGLGVVVFVAIFLCCLVGLWEGCLGCVCAVFGWWCCFRVRCYRVRRCCLSRCLLAFRRGVDVLRLVFGVVCRFVVFGFVLCSLCVVLVVLGVLF